MGITVFGLAAMLLSPFVLIYCAIKLRNDVKNGRRGMVGLLALCALQSSSTIAYFAILFRYMSGAGLAL